MVLSLFFFLCVCFIFFPPHRWLSLLLSRTRRQTRSETTHLGVPEETDTRVSPTSLRLHEVIVEKGRVDF